MRKREHPDTPFPIGTEYYRGPTPRPDCWDGDFARLRAAGFRIVRSHSYWNWMEPSPGRYELDDFDRLFDLAERHDLAVWMDVMLATHGACPEWLTRDVPDLRVVTYRGQAVQPFAGAAYPQGGVIHCYDHPAWREHGGALLRHVVTRYRDRPGLLIWGLWDSINLTSAWSPMTEGYPCYCEHTLARYRRWLRERFTLDALNARVQRRYRSWEDVAPPRSNHNVVEMRLYREFQYENLAGHLRWMVDEVERLDPHHEVRAHGAWYPRPWDEGCAPHVDSWGMSMPSNNLLTGDDPGRLAERAFAFDWSRSVGRGGRWWHEEIYAGMSPAGVTWQKQTDPRELTTLLWLTLAGGAAGAMFWQYRPEYLSFESPGYNLVAPDGEPTARFAAAASGDPPDRGPGRAPAPGVPPRRGGRRLPPGVAGPVPHGRRGGPLPGRPAGGVPHPLDARDPRGRAHPPDGLVGLPRPLPAQRGADGRRDARPDRADAPGEPRDPAGRRGELRPLLGRGADQLPAAGGLRRAASACAWRTSRGSPSATWPTAGRP